MTRARDLADGKFATDVEVENSTAGAQNMVVIHHASNTSGDESKIQFKRTTDGGSDREVAAIVADRVGGNDTALVFETNTDGSDGATERARISHDGKFGVGTNSPQSVTHFKGTSSGENILHLDNSSGSGHGDTNNNVRVVSGNNAYWANLVIAAHSLEFKVQGGSTGITAESDGDLSIADGDLVIGTSGHGISFAATSDGGVSTPSELLDDYEEGTYTPVLASTSATFSYSVQQGTYVKIGQLVYLQFNITLNANPSGTTSNVVFLDNIPFNTHDVHDSLYGGGHIGHYFNINLSAGTTMVYQTPINSTNQLELKEVGDNIGENSVVASELQNGSVIRGSVMYRSA